MITKIKYILAAFIVVPFIAVMYLSEPLFQVVDFIQGPKSKQAVVFQPADYTEAQYNAGTDLTSIENHTGLTPLAVSQDVDCDTGQNNFKVHSGYEIQCSYKQTRLYAIDDLGKTLNDIYGAGQLVGFSRNTVKDTLPTKIADFRYSYTKRDGAGRIEYDANNNKVTVTRDGGPVDIGSKQMGGEFIVNILDVLAADKDSDLEEVSGNQDTNDTSSTLAIGKPISSKQYQDALKSHPYVLTISIKGIYYYVPTPD